MEGLGYGTVKENGKLPTQADLLYEALVVMS
jgi:hypothetical protein